MKVGIIIFSRTGNTLAVAEKIREACLSQGHTAVIERVTAENEDPNATPVKLKSAPDPLAYDIVIFGAPAQAFSLSPIMKAYLAQVPALGGRKVYAFATHHFPKAWLGGKQALGQMRSLCQNKGAEIAETGIVSWSSKGRDAQISDITSRFNRI